METAPALLAINSMQLHPLGVLGVAMVTASASMQLPPSWALIVWRCRPLPSSPVLCVCCCLGHCSTARADPARVPLILAAMQLRPPWALIAWRRRPAAIAAGALRGAADPGHGGDVAPAPIQRPGVTDPARCHAAASLGALFVHRRPRRCLLIRGCVGLHRPALGALGLFRAYSVRRPQ